MEQKRSRAARMGRGTGLVLAGAVGATALTGIAFAQDTDADPTPTEQAPSAASADEFDGSAPGNGLGLGHGNGKGLGLGRGLAIPGVGPILHGDQVVRSDDGEYRAISVQNGTITAVSDTSVELTSEDGFVATYTINADTLIRVDHGQADTAALAVDRPARVIASEGTALRIGSTTPDGQAQIEDKISNRSEFREQLRERLQERLNGAGLDI